MAKRWIAALLAGLACTASLATPAAAIGTHPCANATSRCDGTIEVPLNWADPASERLTLPFVWLPHTDRTRRPSGTIAVLPGGPTTVFPQINGFTSTLGPLLADYNVLVVERRGFGDAGRLHCDDIDVREPESISACATRLGPRIQYFTTDQRVADIDAVRSALGVRKVTLYGSSYGSVEGPAYATRFPQHTAAAIFDSPTLIADRRSGYTNGFSFQGDFDASQDAIDEACEASPACRALPGDTKIRLARSATALRANPDPKVPLRALGSVVKFIDPITPRDSNAALDAYLSGDPLPLRRLVALTGPPPGSDDPNLAIRALGLAVLAYTCNDFAWPYQRLATPAERRKQLAEYRLNHPEHPITSAEATAGAGLFDDWCTSWPTPRQAPPVPPDARYPGIPVLTIAGSFDSDAPANAADLAGRFRQGRTMVVPFAGHSVSLRPAATYRDCVTAAVRGFITRPDRPSPRCSGENFRALGHFPITGKDTLTTAFVTAMDSLSPRIPNTTARLGTVSELPGLRGGKLSFSDQQVTLIGVRYTADVPVSGEILLTGGEATANLTLDASRIRMTWKPFEAKDITTVTGELDGVPFTAGLPTGQPRAVRPSAHPG